MTHDAYTNYYENLPKQWSVCKLQSIISLTSGNDLAPEQYNSVSGDIPYITGASNICYDIIIINRFTDKRYMNSRFGEILFTCKGTVGKIIKNTIGDIHIARQLMSIRSFINDEFLIIYLMSIADTLKKQAKSMIPGIERSDLLNSFIKLPPLSEQERIAEKVKIAFSYI